MKLREALDIMPGGRSYSPAAPAGTLSDVSALASPSDLWIKLYQSLGREDNDGRVKDNSTVSSLGGDIITLAGVTLAPFFWMGNIHSTCPSRSGSWVHQTVCLAKCQGTHTGHASAWGWRHRHQDDSELHNAAHTDMLSPWG